MKCLAGIHNLLPNAGGFRSIALWTFKLGVGSLFKERLFATFRQRGIKARERSYGVRICMYITSI